MAQLKIKRGLSSSLPTIEDGSLLITTDTKKIYLDNGSNRIELSTPPPVTSVNGKTGAVSLTYADVNAAAASHTHSYLPLSGGTMTGSITFANNTWNLIGDDAYFGDRNYAGAICFKTANSDETRLLLINKDETANGEIRLDSYNNLILSATGGIIYHTGDVGLGQYKNIYFDSVISGTGIKWNYSSSGQHLFHLMGGASDGADAANGYWIDMQCHGNSTCPSEVYTTRWINGVEQGRICLLDRYNNTWKTGGTFFVQNGGGITLERMYNGASVRGISMWSDTEGGQFEIYNHNNTAVFCMDAPYDRRMRIYHWDTANNSYCGEIQIGDGTVTGAVWNDYAEFRESNEQIQPGRVVIENGDDTLSLSNERLQPGANIVSDTYGFAIGETSRAQTPIAVSGRVLAYPYESRDTFSAGDAVCSAPNGTVSKMTREEIVMYPERIIGTVSAIPDYETWGTGNVPVNGRIWIKIK